jgi:hypothetical protein
MQLDFGRHLLMTIGRTPGNWLELQAQMTELKHCIDDAWQLSHGHEQQYAALGDLSKKCALGIGLGRIDNEAGLHLLEDIRSLGRLTESLSLMLARLAAETLAISDRLSRELATLAGNLVTQEATTPPADDSRLIRLTRDENFVVMGREISTRINDIEAVLQQRLEVGRHLLQALQEMSRQLISSTQRAGALLQGAAAGQLA